MVKEPPFTFPVKVAVPPVLVIETAPVVVNPAILCAAVPANTIGELPALKTPELLIKSPPKVTWKLPVFNVAPLLIVSGTEVLKTSAEFMVTDPAVFAMITPPDPANGLGHSEPAAWVSVVLYCRV